MLRCPGHLGMLVPSMRHLAIAVTVLLAGCTGLNAAFQDDGSGTDSGDGSASGGSGGTGETSQADDGGTKTTAGTGAVSTSGAEESGDTSSMPSDLPPSTEGFHVPIAFHPREEPLENFVARAKIEAPYLEGVPLEELDFRYPDTEQPVPFEVIEYDPEVGLFDAWVLLDTWGDEGPTVVELVVGFPRVPPQSPWVDFQHVWHLDGDGLVDVAGPSSGEYSGYVQREGIEEGIVGASRAFDGADDVAAVSGLTDPSMTFAVYGWARIDADPDDEVPLFARNAGPPHEELAEDNDVDWAITVDENGDVRALLRTMSGVVMPTATQVVKDGGWHHYGLSVQSNVLWFYIDGYQTYAIFSALPINAFASTLSMAGWSGETAAGDPLFHGALDEVTLTYRELPQTWMLAVYDNQVFPEGTYIVGAPVPE